MSGPVGRYPRHLERATVNQMAEIGRHGKIYKKTQVILIIAVHAMAERQNQVFARLTNRRRYVRQTLILMRPVPSTSVILCMRTSRILGRYVPETSMSQ